MTAVKDYYGILGVLPDAEVEVIRAVYLALAKKYHPDRGGDKAGEEQMKEINEAYEILVDPIKREKYDSEYFKSKSDTGDYDPGVDDEDLNTDDFQDDWNFAVEYCPELKDHLLEISTISPTLSVVYKSTMLTTKMFDKADVIKQDLINDFLRRYFGKNKNIQIFAVSLLRSKHMSAAKELNKVIRTLGSNIDPNVITTKIMTKFNIHEKNSSKNSEKHNESSPSRVFVEKYKEFNIFKVHYDYFVPDLVIQDSKQNYASLDVAKIIIDEELKGEYQTFFLSYRFYKIIVVSLVLLYISGIIYQNM